MALNIINNGESGLIVRQKINSSFDLLNKGRGYVTPEDYGAVGDGVTNDYTALNSAINSGLIVILKDKTYLTNTSISVPDNASIIGTGKNSVIKTTSNISIFNITGSDITIDRVTFAGNSTGTNQTGVYAVGNAGFTLYRVNIKVTNCTFTLLGGFGLYSSYMIGLNSGNEHQGSFYITNCFFYSCYIGVGLYERGEYNTLTNCVISKCSYGYVNNAGNNSFIGGHIADCINNGVTIGTGVNDGHGVVVGTKINHNAYNISATGVITNFTFDCCMIYAGIVTVATSNGFKFTNCEFNTATFTLTNNPFLEFNDCKFTVTATTYTLTGTKPIYRNCWSLSGQIAVTPKTFVPNTLTLTANGTFTVPSGHLIDDIYFENTTANAVTGGIKIGTTNGGTEVIVSQAIAANEIVAVANANILKHIFSSTVDQILYIQAVTSWNSANVICFIRIKPMY